LCSIFFQKKYLPNEQVCRALGTFFRKKQPDMHKKIALIVLLALASFGPLMAQIVPDSCRLRIGTNLSGPSDYGSEWPFVNIMKYGRTWTPHNSQWVSGGQNAWDSGLLDQIPLDANGYPLSLPVEVPGAESPQIVRTLWANTDDLPTGRYVVLYDGEGQLDVWGDATLVSTAPGRLEFDLTHGADIFTLELRQSTLGNHLRNIRVLLPGTEATYLQEPFAASWLEKLAPFGALRFMDWGYTNNSPMRQWADRTQPNDYTWTQKSGIPYEQWIALCNKKNADAWVCVPHAASADYVTRMATLFRDSLRADRKIYVEYSNEVWNWIFTQAGYGHDSLNQSLPWPERLGPRIADVLQIWTDVFEGQEHRLVRVMASQHAWWDLGERTFAQIQSEGRDHLVDAISPAAYMGFDGDYIAANWSAGTTAEQVLEHAAEFTFDPDEYAMRGWAAYAKLARDHQKKLVFYEGGQHFTPNPFGSEQPYCPALLECQVAPGMYDLYQQLFDTLRTLSQQEMLLMNFSFISPLGCRYGSWGALQSQFFEDAPYPDAPKYRALVDANARYLACQTSDVSTPPNAPAAAFVLPNPTSDFFEIKTATPWQHTVLHDALGRPLRRFSFFEKEKMTLGGLPAGVYTLEVFFEKNTPSRVLRVVKQ
jgi:hypothetical protein